jgi:hypoxanthine phosphoribosyltransferase
MNSDIKEVLLTEEQIQNRVRELGAELTKEYADKKVVMIVLLKGAAYFATDLSAAMDMPVRMDFMVASSYGNGTESSGTLVIRLDVNDNIAGKHVLLVDDIIDSGLTFASMKRLLETKHPASIKTVALCDKSERRQNGFQADYVGFKVPDEFVVGYGLDYAGDYRNLPYIGILKSSVYGRTITGKE